MRLPPRAATATCCEQTHALTVCPHAQSFIGAFCFVFAVNSSVHSYLVLRYAEGNKVAVNVGFYYMSNAAGRLVGTVMSGVLYSYAGATPAHGFGWCFVMSAGFVLLCTLITSAIRDDDAGLQCGGLVCVGRLAAVDVEESGSAHSFAAKRQELADGGAASPSLRSRLATTPERPVSETAETTDGDSLADVLLHVPELVEGMVREGTVRGGGRHVWEAPASGASAT